MTAAILFLALTLWLAVYMIVVLRRDVRALENYNKVGDAVVSKLAVDCYGLEARIEERLNVTEHGCEGEGAGMMDFDTEWNTNASDAEYLHAIAHNIAALSERIEALKPTPPRLVRLEMTCERYDREAGKHIREGRALFVAPAHVVAVGARESGKTFVVVVVDADPETCWVVNGTPEEVAAKLGLAVGGDDIIERLTRERDEARLYAENADITALLSRCYACGHRLRENMSSDACPQCGKMFTLHPWQLPLKYRENCGCERCVKARDVTS